MADTHTVEDVTAPEAPPRRRRISKRKAVEEHARSYLSAAARRDAAGMGEHWDPDGVLDLVPLGIVRGREAIVESFRELFAAVPDMETVVGRLVPGEREVVVEWRMSGHFTGAPFQGIEPNGKYIELRGIDLIEIANGKHVTNTAYYDGMSFARQVGLMPPENSGAERAMKGAFNAVTKARRAIAERRGEH